jgi:hypothetical protein
MAQASTSGGEKAASLVPRPLRAKHWRLPVDRDLSDIAPTSSFASRKEPDLRAINAPLRCIQMKARLTKNLIAQPDCARRFLIDFLTQTSQGISA